MDEKFPPMLITCSEKFLLWTGHELQVIEEGVGLYYGITWDHENIYVGSRRRNPGTVRVFDERLNLKGRLPLTFIGDDPHQLFCTLNTLYIADRDHMRVLEWSLGLQHESWHVDTVSDQHINSIWYSHPYYLILEHRQDRPSKRLQIVWDMRTVHKNVDFYVGQQNVQTGYGVHNVYLEGGRLITLAPYEVVTLENFRIHQGVYDSVGKHRLEGVEPEKHYMRGLAATADAFFFGVSNQGPRSQRGEGDTFIVKVNRELQAVGQLVLPDTGQVLEVRVVGEPDFAHNMLRCPYVPDAY
jgi:hypothetical protein